MRYARVKVQLEYDDGRSMEGKLPSPKVLALVCELKLTFETPVTLS
jgi:hypothetical protein